MHMSGLREYLRYHQHRLRPLFIQRRRAQGDLASTPPTAYRSASSCKTLVDNH